MSVQIIVTGIEKAGALLIKKEENTKKAQQKAVDQATIMLNNAVKRSIAGMEAEPRSVDTGRFLNSVQFSTDKNTGVVWTDVEYAKFLEYGTSRMQARKHFRNSFYRKKPEMQKILKTEIKNI